MCNNCNKKTFLDKILDFARDIIEVPERVVVIAILILFFFCDVSWYYFNHL